MEAFYRTHAYLVEHTNAPVRRDLMDEIDWNDRLIGIKGTRGVGKTTFLLQYAKEKFGTDRSCLFINMNNFYFSGHSRGHHARSRSCDSTRRSANFRATAEMIDESRPPDSSTP